MTDQSQQSQEEFEPEEESRFRALLTPNRSLGPKGFLILMCFISGISFTAGLMFWMMGAWPIMGFFGLDVALIYIAFRASYKAGRLHETVELTDEALTVTRVQPSGRSQSWTFNPYWVRIAVERRVGLCSEMSLASHGQKLVFGAFLTDEEREEFADTLRSAIAEGKPA
ncbi:DUF2244 domain-containing protein [Methyloligella solikamskensis]|uniref:DUF2244 domain-containing protein n=1 Tax=Methyloligella solikamskensis TaxID=1177756 RepID=A0ABW3J7U3_9HYPH